MFFAAVLIFGIAHSNAQENIVKASALIGNVGLQYERALGNRFSVIGCKVLFFLHKLVFMQND